MAPDEPSGASKPGDNPRASTTGRAQELPARSNSRVPEASLGSLAASPTSLRRSQSLGCKAQSASATTEGSLVASQCRIGPAIPGTSGLPSDDKRWAGRAR